MSVASTSERRAWSMSIRPQVRATIGDHALWADFARLHRDVPTVAGVVTHPSTTEPVIYSASARTLGDSDAKMRHRGFYASAPTVEAVSDTGAVDGGTVTRSVTPELVRPVADTTGQWWRIDRVGSGNHHRGTPPAHGLTVGGVPMVSKPVKLVTWQRWCALVGFMAQTPCDARPVSLWASVAALVSVMAGRPFTPRALDSHAIMGATVRPATVTTRPRTPDGTRPRRTEAAILSEAATLLAAMLTDGLTPTNGRPSKPRQVAALAYKTVGGIRPAGGDVSHVLASSLRTLTA